MFTDKYKDIRNLVKVFQSIDRSLFVDNLYKNKSRLDSPLPIGHDQTISQPSLVLDMIRLLDVQSGNRILEIGTGTGFQTAILARLVKEIYTIELIEELALKARDRIKELGLYNVNSIIGDGSKGWSENSPYDRIIVTAACSSIPDTLLQQLGTGGKMVIPVGDKSLQNLFLLEKDDKGNLKSYKEYEVMFVEFKGMYGWG